MPANLVIGIDGGGTRTRVAVAGLDGRQLHRAEAGSTNLTSLSRDVVVERLSDAVENCLVGLDPARVRYAVAGYAGAPDPAVVSSTAAVPGSAVAPSYAVDITMVALASRGVHCPVEVLGDPEIAYASGATGPHGLVLVVGTGAVAARIVGGRMRRTVDGHGWLVGDDGSGFWLGAAGLRAALRALDGRGPDTLLVQRLAAELAIDPAAADAGSLRDRLVHAVMHQAPPSLARLAPAVIATEAAGDEVAAAVVRAAVDHLVAAVAVLEPRRGEELVLAGGVVGAQSPLSSRVAGELAGRFGVHPVPTVDGTAGAIRLALAALGHATWASHDAS
jgi:glucosamine kinase